MLRMSSAAYVFISNLLLSFVEASNLVFRIFIQPFLTFTIMPSIKAQPECLQKPQTSILSGTSSWTALRSLSGHILPSPGNHGTQHRSSAGAADLHARGRLCWASILFSYVSEFRHLKYRLAYHTPRETWLRWAASSLFPTPANWCSRPAHGVYLCRTYLRIVGLLGVLCCPSLAKFLLLSLFGRLSLCLGEPISWPQRSFRRPQYSLVWPHAIVWAAIRSARSVAGSFLDLLIICAANGVCCL